MREVVRIQIGDEELTAEVEDGEVTCFRPVNIVHLKRDILACITYIVLIGNAMNKTGRRSSQ